MKYNLTINTKEVSESIEKTVNIEIDKKVKSAIQEYLNDRVVLDWIDDQISVIVRNLTSKNIDAYVAEIIKDVFEKRLLLDVKRSRGNWTSIRSLVGSLDTWVEYLDKNEEFKRYLDNIISDTAINHPELLEQAVDCVALDIKRKVQDYVNRRHALLNSKRFL